MAESPLSVQITITQPCISLCLYVCIFRKCSRFLGEELTVRTVLKGAAPFSMLWSLSGYLSLLALCHISKVDVSAVLCCGQAFVFLLSWIGLKDRFMGVRVSIKTKEK